LHESSSKAESEAHKEGDIPGRAGLTLEKERMYLNRAEYDRGVNTFSPEGRLFQVEYAIEAIKVLSIGITQHRFNLPPKLGSTAIGIQAQDGVLLAVEKRITSPLMVPSSIEKVFEIDRHIGCACSGLTADARMLVEHARVEAQVHVEVPSSLL